MPISPIRVARKRKTVVRLTLGMDVSADEFSSEIRVDKDPEAELLATWDCSFEDDGTDGVVLLELDDTDGSVLDEVEYTNGWMDVKRVSAGAAFDVFSDPLPVVIEKSVTT